MRTDSVMRIDIVDSTAQGGFIGAVAGVGVPSALVAKNRDELATSSLAGVGYAFLFLISVVPCLGVGQLVDLRHNEPI